jgi:hypothetical protein
LIASSNSRKPPLQHIKTGTVEFPNLVIFIPENTSTGKEISTREARKSLAEEIRRMTGEGIETLQFVGDKIISQGRERESIHFCEW